MVEIYKSEFTLLQQEILRYFFLMSGKSFNERRLAIVLDKTQTGIAKALPTLEKKGLIKTKKDRESGRWSITLNKENPKVIALKRAENLRNVYESGLVSSLAYNFPGCAVILFGSYSRGEDVFISEDNKSDIDLAIVGAKEKILDLKKFEKMLEREIIINFYPSFKEIHKDLKDNILNGIILSGSVDL